MVVNLVFVAVVNRHPFLARLEGDANEDTGIIVEIAHLVDDADAAVAELAAGPIEQAHAAVRLNESVFHRHVAWADVFPAGEILAVEERLPSRSLRPRGGKCEQRRDGSDDQQGYPFARSHGAFLLGKIEPSRALRRGRSAPARKNQNCKL